MSVLSASLRVGPDGRLERCEAADAVCALIGVMSATPATFWAHAPWFGLHQVFQDARLERQDQPGIADAVNRALRELGVNEVRVDSCSTSGSRGSGERKFDFTLAIEGQGIAFRTVEA